MILHLLNPDNYRLTLYALPLFVSGSAIAALGIFVLLRDRGSRLGVIFWLFTICISLWLLATGANYASIEKSLSEWFIGIMQYGIVWIPAAVVTLTVAIVQRRHQYRLLVRVSWALSLLFFMGMAMTDLFLKGIYRYFWGYYGHYGSLGAAFVVFFSATAGVSLHLFWQEYRQSRTETHRKRLKGLLWAFSVGYLGGVDFFPTFGIPLYPFGYIPVFCFIGIASWVIVRYRLVDLTPELATGQILETMHGAVIVVDLEGRIRVVNQTAENMLGQGKMALLGNRLSSVLALPGSYSDAEQIRQGKIRNLEMVVTSRDGRKIDVSLSASFVEERKSDPVGIVYAMQDITERKRDEEKLKEYSEELVEINEELKNFTYIVSHDLRAPLVNIKGFSQEFMRAVQDIEPIMEKHLAQFEEGERRTLVPLLKEDIPQALAFIGSSVDRMDNLINAVLKLSRAGRRKLSPELLHTKQLVQTILGSLAHQIESRKVNVTLGELPDIAADKMALEQVFGNLLDNAVKYLAPDRPGRIEISAEHRNGEVVFHVLDNGRGMAKEDIPKAFDLFRRVGQQDVPGDGMGLAYVKTLVRALGGRIWCESEPGTGTTFSFAVPVDAEPEIAGGLAREPRSS